MSTRFENHPTLDFQDQIPKRVLPRIVIRQLVFNEDKEAAKVYSDKNKSTSLT